MAAEFQGVLAAFKKLDNSVKILEDLKAATSGTVSEMELMQNALKAENFRIPMDVLAKGLEFATKRASETGESVDYLVNSFTVGLGRESIKILDNLGISAVELNKEVKLTGDFMAAVGNIMDRELSKMGDVILTDAQRMDKFKASIKNVRIEFGQLILKGFTPLINMGNKILDYTNRQSKALRDESTQLRGLVGVATSANISEEARLRVIKDIQKEYPDFLGNIEAEKVTNEQLTTSLRETNLQYKEKIKLAILQEALADEQGKLNKKIGQEVRLTGELNTATYAQAKAQDRYNEAVKNGSPLVDTYLQDLGFWNTRIKNLNERLGRNTEGQEKWQSTIAKTTDAIERQLKVLGLFNSELEDLEDKSGVINQLVKQLAELTEQRNAASKSEITALNIEIKKVEEKIKYYKSLGEEVLPEVLEVINRISNVDMPEIEIDFGSGDSEFDEMTRQLIARNEEMAEAEVETRKKTIAELRELNEEAFAAGEISWTTYERNKTLITKEAEKRRDEIFRAGIETATDIVRSFTDLYAAQKQKELSTVGDNAAKRLAIERKYAKKEQQLAYAQAIINIAQGVTKAIAQGGILGLITGAIVAAAGAIQLNAIAAQKFAKGTESSPEGPAIVGEKGRELRIEPSGKMSLTPGKPTLTNLEKGTKIYPADITNELLKYSYVASAMPEATDSEILMMMGELGGIKRAIKNKPVTSSIITPAGILTATTRGNTTIKRMDKFFK